MTQTRPADRPSRAARRTTGERPRRPGGAALRAVALVAVALLAAACGASATPSPSGGTASGAPSAAGPSSVPTATTPADRLAAAFAGLGSGYTFETSVTVGSKVATHVTGRSVGGASEFVLDAGGQSVTYRSVPPQAWVQKPGAGWVLVGQTAPAGDPLAQLAKPQGTKVVSDDQNALVIDATYPPSALGLSGTDPVHVTLSVAADGSITATYAAQMSAGSATSTTVLKPSAGQQPIVAPSTAPSPSAG